MDDFRGNLFSTTNTKWTIYRYTRFTIYIVKFVCFVLKIYRKVRVFRAKKNIVKFVYFVLKKQIEKSCLSCLKENGRIRDIRAAILPARIKYI